MTETTPSGSIPISFYSTVNKGNLVVRLGKGPQNYQHNRDSREADKENRSSVLRDHDRNKYEIIPPLQISHHPQWKTPQIYYEYIKTPSSFMGMAPGEPTFKERRELGDYAIVSCEVNRSINDAYMQLSTEFQNLTVPPEGSTIKHNCI